MLEKITSDEIVKKLAKEHDISLKNAKDIIKFVNKRIKKSVLDGHEIRFSNIATLTFNKKKYLDFIEKKIWQK